MSAQVKLFKRGIYQRRVYLPLSEILLRVADGLALASDEMPSATTIRCTINDWIDGLGKEGWRVPPHYSQARAIVKMRRLIRARWELIGRYGRDDRPYLEWSGKYPPGW